MDPLLILIILLLVTLIGYILSRPFENPPDYRVGVKEEENLQKKYDSLLLEIKTMQREIQNSDNPDDLENRIEAKKRQAADLLRHLNPELVNESHS